MDVIRHSKIGTQHTMIEVINSIKVLLKLTRRSDYFMQYEECVTAMKSICTGEIMALVHIADQSDKAPVTEGLDSWKFY